MLQVEKANKWREELGLSMAQLSRLSGYSIPTLHWYFKGVTAPRGAQQKSRPIDPPEWRRFTNVCAGVHAQLKAKQTFDWGL